MIKEISTFPFTQHKDIIAYPNILKNLDAIFAL